jgi:methylated-DNA-[protein]-cysteine S-methyltransferase
VVKLIDLMTKDKEERMKTFSDKIYDLLRKVPAGRVTTYKELAHALGTKAYRGVGQSMRKNPYAPKVPCHRVVAASGRIGGFQGKTSGTSIQRKIKMLQDEGVEIHEGKIKNFEEILYRFT